MNLCSFFRPNRTSNEIDQHKAERLAEAVARKLQDLSAPVVPNFYGSTTSEHARHRELEITIRTDLGWGDPLAYSLMRHHAKEAVVSIKSFARNWTINTHKGGVGGWNNLPKHVNLMVDSLRARIDPAIFVAEAEFDPRQIFRTEYYQIESLYKCQVDLIGSKNQTRRIGASKYKRTKIRQEERVELQVVIDSFAEAIDEWQVNLCNVSYLV
jgi:hypothetical protein